MDTQTMVLALKAADVLCQTNWLVPALLYELVGKATAGPLIHVQF